VKIPVADGGEGSVDAFLKACGGEKRYVRVKGPYLLIRNRFSGARAPARLPVRVRTQTG